jgi:hypothetical protein
MHRWVGFEEMELRIDAKACPDICMYKDMSRTAQLSVVYTCTSGQPRNLLIRVSTED